MDDELDLRLGAALNLGGRHRYLAVNVNNALLGKTAKTMNPTIKIQPIKLVLSAVSASRNKSTRLNEQEMDIRILFRAAC